MEAHDAALVLAVKNAEISMLQQQLNQLAEDMQRSVALMSSKDVEVTQLRDTVNHLRAMLSEKDRLFAQFQEQVQDLEALRIKEVEQRSALEHALAVSSEQWQQQLQAAEKARQAEVTALQQELKAVQDKCSAQLMQTRQLALDDSMQRSTQYQAALQAAADIEAQLKQQLKDAAAASNVKDAELEAAHRQLGQWMENLQLMEANHKQASAAKEGLIKQLQIQITQLSAGSTQASEEHEINMNKLIASISNMQETCQAQAQEVQQYAAKQKQVKEDCRGLREQLQQQDAIITKLQTERDVLDAALQHQVTSQASAQAELNIVQTKLLGVVAEVEQRCTAVDGCCATLKARLAEQRGQLADAVVAQANSPTHKVELLAQALEPDRLRTQVQLQLAQERSQVLAEQLALLRAMLLPLLPAHNDTAAPTYSLTRTSNQSLAALAQLMQSSPLQPGVAGIAAGPAAAGVGATGHQQSALAETAAMLGSSYQQANALLQQYAPNTPGGQGLQSQHIVVNSSAAGSAAGATPACAGVGCNAHSPASPLQLEADRLAGVMQGMNADMDRLQDQLDSSKCHVQHSKQQLNAAWARHRQEHPANSTRLSPAGSSVQHRSSSPAHSQHRCKYSGRHSQQGKQHRRHSSGRTPQNKPSHTAICGTHSLLGRTLHEMFQQLLQHTEQLTNENQALKAQLLHEPHATWASAESASKLPARCLPLHSHRNRKSVASRRLYSGQQDSSHAQHAHESLHRPACSYNSDVDNADDDAGSKGSEDTQSSSSPADGFTELSRMVDEQLAMAARLQSNRLQTPKHSQPCATSQVNGEQKGCKTSSAGGISGKDLLQTVLASWPANDKLGKLMRDMLGGKEHGSTTRQSTERRKPAGGSLQPGLRTHTPSTRGSTAKPSSWIRS